MMEQFLVTQNADCLCHVPPLHFHGKSYFLISMRSDTQILFCRLSRISRISISGEYLFPQSQLQVLIFLPFSAMRISAPSGLRLCSEYHKKQEIKQNCFQRVPIFGITLVLIGTNLVLVSGIILLRYKYRNISENQAFLCTEYWNGRP